MPTFPTYHGDLPPCLNPLNLHHYFLLVYWIFFRPTALKCYLYQADAELYRGKKSGWNEFRQVPAYRNLILMVPGTILLLSVLVGGMVMLLVSWIQGKPIDVLKWMRGVAFGVAGGVTGGVAVGVAVGVAGGVAGGVAFGVEKGVTVGLAIVVGFIAGSLRLPFYLPQWFLAKFYPNFRHPLLLDELLVLPLPNSRQLLTHFLQQDEPRGMYQLAEVACNPFQRWAVQQVLYEYLHQQEKPLHFFYKWLVFSELNVYVFAPHWKVGWKSWPDRRQLLLGELGEHWGETNLDSEKTVWWLTKPLRHRQSTPLTQFARLLYALYKREREAPLVTLNQPWAQTAYTQVENYPGGIEISRSFTLLRTFLNYQTLTDFTFAPKTLKEAKLPDDLETALRPTVLRALIQLGTIGAEVTVYQDSTSRANKLAALARAAESLEQLKTWVTDQINVPEGYILQTIITQWQPLITKAAGEIGQFALSAPVPNPYVAGNPVKPPLFVGREDILRRLEELWSKPGQCDSVVLYGHRRMGKSSILQNLGMRFGTQTYLVDFNMQRVGFVHSTGELLYHLALACYDELPPTVRAVIKEPDRNMFTTHDDPYNTFDRFLKQLDKHRQGWRIIVTIDEFELIETGFQEGRLEPHLLESLRGIIQTYTWFILALAGLHTLEEMCHDYWQPLFGSVKMIPVSFLTAGAARQLIIQPDPDFPIDYDEAAIVEIIRLTHGQPYLVQQIGHSLVSRFNRQTFEEGLERERRFTLDDVQAVITSPEFFRDGNAYFTGVWSQAEESQHQVLKTLAPSVTGMTMAELGETTQLSEKDLEEALEILKQHDVVQEEEGKWAYRVELMRRWVKANK